MPEPTVAETPPQRTADSRVICTPERPWRPEDGRSVHPAAVYQHDVYDQSADHDDYAVYHCPLCGLTFEVTLAN